MATVASRDGTRGYSLANPGDWTARYNNGANLVAIGKLQRFENVHLSSQFSDIPATGNLARPSPVSSGVDNTLGRSSFNSATPFDWPLGKAFNAGQYSFTKVIHFDPQGIARVQTATNKDAVTSYIEIGLIPTRGNVAPTSQNLNAAIIQVDGLTGATRIYRP